MAPNKKITVILNKSVHAQSFPAEELIHQHEFEYAKKLINAQIELAKGMSESQLSSDGCNSGMPSDETRNRTEFRVKRYHNTISIFGDRGTGKTSFLASLLAYYQNETEHKIAVLKIIDPTIVEEKGHFFLLILSLINEQVEKRLQRLECCPDLHIQGCRKEWRQCLNELAKGIPSLDRIGRTYEDSSWQDPEYIMNNGLSCFQAAFHLEENFHQLIRKALKILNKELFLIAFDDIDVDFKKGWPVLEVIRKYMTTPYVITLLSGNMKLYVKNIRKQQWDNLSKGLLKNEAKSDEGQQAYTRLVNEIEGQYLLKILKPENRIHLNTIYVSMHTYGYEYNIQIKEKDDDGKERQKETEILSFYNEILHQYGIHNPYQMEAYRSFLLNLSIRSQLHFLMTHREEPPTDIRCIDAFLSRMYANNIDVDLAANTPKMLNIVILRYLLKQRLVVEAYQLQPTLDNMDINSCLMGFSLLFAQKARKNCFLIFDYFSRIGLTRNLANILPYAEEGVKKTGRSIDGICRYAGIFQDKILRDIVGRSLGYLRSYKLLPRVAGYRSFQNVNLSSENNIDVVFQDKPIVYKILANIPLCRLQVGNQTENGYSFDLLLSSIGELIKIVQVDGDLYAALKSLGAARKYQARILDPVFIDNSEGDTDTDTQILSDDDSQMLQILSKNFKKWIEEYNENMGVPVHLLGKISTRVYYALKRIDQVAKQKKWELGKWLNRCVIAFLNAVLVEETTENFRSWQQEKGGNKINIPNNINTSNTIESGTVLCRNVKFLQKHQALDMIPFTRWIFKCPLLAGYIDWDGEKDLLPLIEIKDIQPSISFLPAQTNSGSQLTFKQLLNKVKMQEAADSQSAASKETKTDISEVQITNPALPQ